MVSVFEKCFIDRVGSGDCHSDSNCPSQEVNNVLKIDSPLDYPENVNLGSRYHKEISKDNFGPTKERRSKRNNFDTCDLSGRNMKTDGWTTPNRKSIIWRSDIIHRINNTLCKNIPSSSTNNYISDNENLGSSFGEECESNSYYKLNGLSPASKSDPGKYSPYPKKHIVREFSKDVFFQLNRKRRSSRFDESYEKPLGESADYRRNETIANYSFNKEYVDQSKIVIDMRRCALYYEDWIRTYRPKIYLLGDSHTRFLACIIMEMLPGFLSESTVKPGAKTKWVLSSLPSILASVTKNDFVVIITGTNDMWSESLEEPKSALYDAISKFTFTNLILCNVPNNYLEEDNDMVQDNILSFNQYYKDIVNFSSYAHLVNLFNLKERSLFTKHGLHFNLLGKIKICEMVSKKILDIIDTIKNY